MFGNLSKRFIYKYAYIIMIIIIIIHFINIMKKSNENNSFEKKFNFKNSVSSKTEINFNCSPFDLKNDNYYVEIDNQIYPKSLPLYLNKTINFKCLNLSHNVKLILLWTPFYEKISYGYGLGFMKPFQLNKCPISNCEITIDKSRINESDFVLVHMRNNIENLPKYRPLKQRWIFNLYESPVHSPNFRKYRNFFNYTSTYRIDSDFPRLNGAYKRFVWKENPSFNEFYNFHKNKTKFAVAVISNCGATSQRIQLINKLRNFIKVDIYGNCGLPCNDKNNKITSCKERLANEYKFYFSFENSLCQDYITEKLFEILRYPIIPVVFGLGNYQHILPKTAYINVLDYGSIKELSDYLIYLDKNSTAYNSYFKWKKYVEFDSTELIFSPLCDMCIKLHLEEHLGIEYKVINEIDNLWNVKSNCKNVEINNSILTVF